MKKLLMLAVAAMFFLAGCNGCNNTPANPVGPVAPAAAPVINYAVTGYIPHDTNSFTEGLLVHNGQLYESTGYPRETNLPQTKSLFGVVDKQTGKINVKAEIDKNKYFGEGISFLGSRLYQLTLSPKIGFMYDTASFKKLGEFTFPGKEGWGLTTDGTSLIMSDGTGTLYYLEPVTLKTVKTVTATENGTPADSLNELEYINGYIYANVWLSNTIVKIDPATGNIAGRLNFTTLVNEVKAKYPGAREMNGIAWDAQSDEIYVTGKLWPTIYQVQFPH